MTDGRLWYSSAKEIGEAIGCGRKEIGDMVRDDGLPAFKYKGSWRAMRDDIKEWLRGVRDQHLCEVDSQ